MSASKVLALITLFLATMFAQTEWKEFTSPEGNFRVVFPETPQEQKGAERNLHQFSATAGVESYGLTYADYPPGTDWESVVVGQNTGGELAIYFVGHRLYVLHAFAPKGTQRPENFSTFLNSFLLLSKPKP